MITYPFLEKGATIGVTAPSSGVRAGLHDLLKLASSRMEERGYTVTCGETAWTQEKAKSAPARIRAKELQDMMSDERISLVFPPWGGELLIELLEHIDFAKLGNKWVLGYSDTSLLLLVVTLQRGIATAHGTNLIDLRGEFSDATTAMWEKVLSTEVGSYIVQQSSELYQKKWQHDNPTPCVFHLTEQTEWKTIAAAAHATVKIEGRLLGGCIDVIRHIIGTPYGDVRHFQENFIQSEPIVWYLENCELSTADLRRSLVQMKLAGWFANCSGIMFGRSPANMSVDGYTAEDVYQELFSELRVPIVYDIDCGHVPPQLTLVNGAYAKLEVEAGKGVIIQYFKP